MKPLYSILLILVLITSCGEKDRKIVITGQVNDPVFGIGAAGVKVSVKSAKVTSGVYNANYVEIASATTDANGSFSVEILVEKSSGYRFVLSKTDYFEISEDVTADKVEDGETYNCSFQIYPQATVRLEVKNVMPLAIDDEIKYRFTNIEQECKTCCNNNIVTGTGPAYSSTTECLVRGNKMIHINWVVTKNGNQNLYSDSIYAEAFKTNTFKINY